MDVTDGARVKQVIDEAAARFGRLDIVINNAGVVVPTPIDSADFEETWASSLDILLTSHTRTVRAALPYLRRSDAARIVNVSSTEGLGATRFTTGA